MTPPASSSSVARGPFAAPKLRTEPTLVEALVSPLPLALLRAALPRQEELHVPAKLILSERGQGGLLAEVPRLEDRERCEAHACQVIEVALAWLEGDLDVPGPSECASIEPHAIEEALGLLPWSWETREEGYRIHAIEAFVDCHVEVRASVGQMYVSTPPMALPASEPCVVEALQIFALEANRCLRLARLTATEARDRVVRVLWDAPLPSNVEPNPLLAEAVQAVVGARSETARALRALCEPRVARTYLELRSVREAYGKRTGCNREPAGESTGPDPRS